MALTLFICGDVELNPGPRNAKSSYNSLLCHWNLKSLRHDFSILSLIEAYNSHHNFGLIYLSATYLDSPYVDDDSRLNLKDFTSIRIDNPHNFTRGGDTVYFNEYPDIRPVSPSPRNGLCWILTSRIKKDM